MSHSQKPATRQIAFVIAIWIVIPLPIMAQEEASSAKLIPALPRVLSDQQQAELKEVQRIAELAWRHSNRGQFAEAIELAIKAVEINSRLQGADHATTGMLLNDLAAYYMDLKDYKKARELLLRAVRIREIAEGAEHPGTAASLHNLAGTYWSENDFQSALPLYRRALLIRQKSLGTNHLETAWSHFYLGHVLRKQGAVREAIPHLLHSLSVFEKSLGQNHPVTLETTSVLANQYLAMAQHKEAEPLFVRAFEIAQQSLGKDHPETAICLSNLGSYYMATADYNKAEEKYLECLSIRTQRLGSQNTSTQASQVLLGMLYSEIGRLDDAGSYFASALKALETANLDEAHAAWVENNCGAYYQTLGHYRKAEALLRSALNRSERVHGKSHPETTSAVSNLAVLFRLSGDFARAEPYYLRAIADNEMFLGPNHPQLAQSLINLGEMYTTIGAFSKAEQLFRRALKIQEDSLGDSHPIVAVTCNNLGLLFNSTGMQNSAKEYHKRSLDIREFHFGANHPLIAASLANLANVYVALGQFQEAVQCFERAASIKEGAFGSDSDQLNSLYCNWGSALSIAGDHKAAEPLLRRGLESGLKLLEDDAAFYSQQQQLRRTVLEGPKLQNYFCLSMAAPEYAENCYGYVLRWKGSVLARQRLQRATADDTQLLPKFQELQTVTTRLSTLAMQTPLPHQQDAWCRQITEFAAAKEQLEQELSRKSAAFRAARSRIASPAEVRSALPENAVLIDFIEDLTLAPDNPRQGAQVAAFILQKDKPLKLLALAKGAEVRQVYDSWQAGNYGATTEGRVAGEQLRKLLWEPLEKHLPGVKTVLVSPFGELNKLPFGALPGRQPGSYLIEDYAFAVVPVPSVLVNPLNAGPDGETNNLLAVGAVNYDIPPDDFLPGSNASVTTRAVTGRKELRFGPLAGTGPEVLAVGRAFRAAFPHVPPVRLAGDQATEAAFRAAAPKHRFLHLATHGFFADPAVRSALARDIQGHEPFQRKTLTDQSLMGHHPDLLSGIVLAGANHPAEEGDDGILTAAEVQAMDLRVVQLVTLSACETGLGQSAGGEGLLGLQRAFQVAGAKNVVASLWKVDDAATQALMTEFYTNLWQKKLPPVEALRQAQVRMIVDYTPTEGKLRAGFAEKPIDERALAEARARQKAGGSLPPFYWAGFVISGSGQ